MNKKTIKTIVSITYIFLIYAFIATILSNFSKFYFIFDICSHFKVQYFLIAILTIVIYFITNQKNKRMITIALIVLLLNFFPLISNIKIYPITTKKTESFSVGLLNLYTANNAYDKVRQELISNNPNILVIQEIDDIWSKELTEVKNLYPFIYEITRDDNFGIALYSDIPIKKVKKMIAGPLQTPMISADLEHKDNKFEVIAVHTTPPTSSLYFENTKRMLENISKYINAEDKTYILIGDINTSFFSYNYKNFKKKTKLQETGNIFTPTWCTKWLFPMRISLDHILVSKNIKTLTFKTGKKVNSDHFPIYATLTFKK